MRLAKGIHVAARLSLCAIVTLTFLAAQSATGIVISGASLLENGDFATGDLTGWTTLPDPGGALGVMGVSSYGSASVSTDGSLISGAIFNGGSLVQSLDLSAGFLVIAANVASVIDEIAFSSFAGGPPSTFELLLDGAVVDTVTINSTNFTLQRETLLFTTDLATAGNHEIGIRHIASAPPTEIPGDGDGDGRVGLIDFAVWANHWQQPGGSMLVGDYDLSGEVDIGDFIIWANDYGRDYNPMNFVEDVQAVVFADSSGFGGGGDVVTPEPGSLVIWSLLGALFSTVAWRQRRKTRCDA